VARRRAPRSRVVAVVKADAYGHGADLLLPGLEEADVLAVATLEEAEALRSAGFDGRLLLLEGFNGRAELDAVSRVDAEYVVHHPGQVSLLEAHGGHAGRPSWLKLDTGMHRLGFPAVDAHALFGRLAGLANGVPPVLMSHFACADEADNPMTARQIERFDEAVAGLNAPASLANSAALLNHPESQRDYVRPGLMLYGISPRPGERGEALGLRPVMTLSCRLLAINTAERGETVGYGGRFRCPERMRIGVAGIGYGDGYPRAVPDGTPVLLNGRRATIAGRVSMDMITLDLRGHDDAEVGDQVVLWGEGLPVEEIAARAGVIPWELVCGVTGRVRRVAVDG
jgi:alanine racemase